MIPLLVAVLIQSQSPTLTSAIRARALLGEALAAMGGLAAIESIDGISREYTGTRTDAGQNVREPKPGERSEINGRPHITRVRNYRTGDMVNITSDTIPGGQPFALRYAVHGDSGFSFMYDAATLRRTPPPPQAVWRAIFQNEEVEGLLLSAWRQGTARAIGPSAIVFTDPAQVATTIYFNRATRLPLQSETLSDDPIRGDVVTETRYGDWRAINGLKLPYLIETLVNGEPQQRLQLLAVRFGAVPDSLLRIPSDAVESSTPPATPIGLGSDVFVVPSRYQSAFVVFDDYVLVFEPGGSPGNARFTIATVKQVAPTKPIRYVVATHAHFDHLAGVREYVALGATFVTTPAAKRVIQRASKATHVMQPDSLSLHPRAPIIDTLTDEVRVFRDRAHEVRVYNLGPTSHVAAMLFAYVPSVKTLFVADALDIPEPGHVRMGGEDTERLAERIAGLKLDVERIVPVHGRMGTVSDLNAALAKRASIQRRAAAQEYVQIRTPDNATICALVMRPRTAERLPALFQFTIYVDSARNVAEVRRSLDHGYAGVIAYTRGKACSPQTPVPYVHDGADAAVVIDWIARQPWSDGRVGMYGGSYSGFTAWAATKHMPKALKAIMVGAPVAPAIDVPMEGNIVWNFVYPWPFYTINNKTLDTATYFDNARWWKLNRGWYVSGRAYRDLAKIDGTPNPIWDEWLAHPSYDAYWRALIPNGAEFANIDIPVLQTAGYFYGGPGAAVYYFTQHLAHNPAPRHYLLIGPYDHFQAQRGVVTARGDTIKTIAGYETDPVARINMVADLHYPFFDWVLKRGPRPPLLADRMNYEVLGANVWRHAPSIAAMSNGTLRLYLNPTRSGNAYRLTRVRALPDSGVTLRADLSYRGDIDTILPGGAVRDTAVNTYLALEYVSDPIAEPMEVSGLYSGHLEFVTNKRDFDLFVQLFELTPDGHYMQLPPFQVRASYNRDPATRRLLTPGARETMDFTAQRLISRKLEPGSRIVLVIGPIKGPGQQINYGSGKDVSDETVHDAGEPLEIRWFGASYVEVPVRR